MASVSVPFSGPVASSTPFTTLNEVGVNVPLKVPVPSALVNVPVTADVMLFAAAAVVAAGAAEPGEVAAEALVIMIAGAPIPIDNATADAVIRRALGSFMCFTSLCFSFGHEVSQLANKGILKLVHPYLSAFHDHLLAILCVFPQVAARNGRHQLASKKFFPNGRWRARRMVRGFADPWSNQVCQSSQAALSHAAATLAPRLLLALSLNPPVSQA